MKTISVNLKQCIIRYARRADKRRYRHDRRADKRRYRHDRGADKRCYRHDPLADSQCHKADTYTLKPFLWDADTPS